MSLKMMSNSPLYVSALDWLTKMGKLLKLYINSQIRAGVGMN